MKSIRKDIENESNSKIAKYFEENSLTKTIKFDQIKQFMNNKGDLYEINFGKSILCWLKYGDEPTFPTFKDEMINNPSSTINTIQYKQYEKQCKIKYDNPNINIERYTLKELIAIKIYCDTNEYQSALRRAFWVSANITQYETKKNFYRWASKLYELFLYAAKPPPRTTNKSSVPCSLYHGLNQIFIINNDLPKYNGIFSASISENTAHSFSNACGLLWSIKGSYTNRFNFITGIDVQWISCHPNEAEFTLFNQFIPIKSTINFATTDDERIDMLMQQLKTYEKRIISPHSFYKKLGFTYKHEWKDKILNHRYFNDQCTNGMRVCYRLMKELNIDLNEMILIQSDINSDYSRDIQVNLPHSQMKIDSKIWFKSWDEKSNTGGVIQLKFKNIYMENNSIIEIHGKGGAIVEMIAETVINRGRLIGDVYSHNSSGDSIKITTKRFENYGTISVGKHSHITIVCEEYINEGAIIPIAYVEETKYDHEIVQFTPIKRNHDVVDESKKKDISPKNAKQNSHKMVNQDNFFHFVKYNKEIYRFSAERLFISSKVHKCGRQTNEATIQIMCVGTLIIQQNGMLKAQYDGNEGIGKGEWVDRNNCGGGGYGTPGNADGAKGGKVYGEKTLKYLYCGSPIGGNKYHSFCGGIIEIIANCVINKGTIECNGERYRGSGGSIKITSKRLENYGQIMARSPRDGDGRIAIFCEEYINEGAIVPYPYIDNNHKYKDKMEFTKVIDSSETVNVITVKQNQNPELQFDGVVNQFNFFHFFYQQGRSGQYEANKLIIPISLNLSSWNFENNLNGGVIQIKCFDTLIIRKNGEINGFASGYNCYNAHGNYGGGYGSVGSDIDKDKGATDYGDKTLKTLYYGLEIGYDTTNSRGGGIIEIIAKHVVNEGIISCNGWCGGSGGSIKITAKTIENYGEIIAKGSKHRKFQGRNGRIAIFYEDKFLNKGKVEPAPFIDSNYVYHQNRKFTPVANIKINN